MTTKTNHIVRNTIRLILAAQCAAAYPVFAARIVDTPPGTIGNDSFTGTSGNDYVMYGYAGYDT